MTDSKTISKVTRFVSKELTQHLGDVIIFKNPEGSYELFNKYNIVTNNQVFIVTLDCAAPKEFSSLKTAVTWCIFDQKRKTKESVRIEELDRLMDGIDTSICIHKRMIKNSKDISNTLIHLAKLNEEQLKKKIMKKEMVGYVNQSKTWQEKNFSKPRQNIQ